MWRRKFALSLVLCVLLQPVSIFAGQINRTEEAFAATACNGVNFSYNLVISETDAKITVCAIGGCGVEEMEAHVEMQKEGAQGWTGYADWRYVKQGMRLSGEEHCLVEPGVYRLKITFYLRGDESGEVTTIGDEVVAGMDLGLERETAQAREIVQRFLEGQTGDVTYENPQETGQAYIPDGAWCTDVSRVGDVLYIDYRLDDVRYLIGYYRDGTVEKTVREMDGDVIYTLYSDREGVEQLRLKAAQK